jgi:mannosyl-oligosaccharide alpha-1,2-mannosidase
MNPTRRDCPHVLNLSFALTLLAVVRVCMVALAVTSIFLAGVVFGHRFFDEEVPGSEEKPWLSLTRSVGAPKERVLPPGMRGTRRAPADVGALDYRSGGGAPVAAASRDAASLGASTTVGAPVIWGDMLAASRAGVSLLFQGASSDGDAGAGGVSGGAWIYLSSESPTSTINTVASNRAPGCELDDKHRGFSFFINSWETQDRTLVLEWRDSTAGAGGCGRLSSVENTIPYDQWVHVAFALVDATPAAPGKAMLFLNGELLRVGVSARSANDAALNAPLSIGAATDKKFPLYGRLSNFFLVAGVMTPKQLTAAMLLQDARGWSDMAAAAEGHLLAQVLLSGGELDGTSALAAPDGLSASDTAAVARIGTSRLLAIDLVHRLTPSDAKVLPTAAEIAAEAAALEARVAEAAKLALEMGADASGAPRSRRVQGATGANVPSSIRRESTPGSAVKGAFQFADGGNQWVPKLMRTPKSSVTGSAKDPAALAAGTFSDDFTVEELAASDSLGRVRALAVKGAMEHVWKNYAERAWGMDELKPVSGGSDNNWAGIGMTLIDSLDTLWLMGMTKEFDAAREWVTKSLSFDRPASVSVFEITIRALGGLLAAFDLSGDNVFLEKAKDLGTRLLPAFNTPTGIPRATVNLQNGASSNPGWTGGSSILSELGTLQVEFRYLSHASGNAEYGRKAEAVIEKLSTQSPPHGLFPIYVSADSGSLASSQVAFGALGDSFFEYLIKVWVQGGRTEPLYRKLYDTAMNGMTDVLLKRSRPSNLAYIADYDGTNTQDKMDHLVCFVPGMLALGALNAAGTPGEANALRDLTTAKALAYTCWQMYERQATGIGAEFVEFPGGADLIAAPRAPFYILRPEAAEALFVMHQLTGNPVYREWGWAMFQAIDKHCKTKYGYGAHPDVREPGRTPDDRMER